MSFVTLEANRLFSSANIVNTFISGFELKVRSSKDEEYSSTIDCSSTSISVGSNLEKREKRGRKKKNISERTENEIQNGGRLYDLVPM